MSLSLQVLTQPKEGHVLLVITAPRGPPTHWNVLRAPTTMWQDDQSASPVLLATSVPPTSPIMNYTHALRATTAPTEPRPTASSPVPREVTATSPWVRMSPIASLVLAECTVAVRGWAFPPTCVMKVCLLVCFFGFFLHITFTCHVDKMYTMLTDKTLNYSCSFFFLIEFICYLRTGIFGEKIVHCFFCMSFRHLFLTLSVFWSCFCVHFFPSHFLLFLVSMICLVWVVYIVGVLT